MKITIKSFIFLILWIVTSCSNKKEIYDEDGNKIKEFYIDNNKLFGEYKEFYKNGNLKQIHYYKDGKLKDSSVYYDLNQKVIQVQYYKGKDSLYVKNYDKEHIMSEGKYFNQQKIGKWKYYKFTGKIEKIIEFIDLCGKQYTNQGWYFDDKGDTLKKYGNYYSMSYFPMKPKVNEDIYITLKYKPILFQDSKISAAFNPIVSKDFCNISDVKLYNFVGNSTTLKTRVLFQSNGEKNIRGYIKEYYEKKPTKDDPTFNGARFIYFDIPFKIE